MLYFRSITQEAIIKENKTFGDILQGSFLEHYKNLTYKTLMGMKWASSICINATFILKVDDDVVFLYNQTYDTLSKCNVADRGSFLLGNIMKNEVPVRDVLSKWYVSKYEYLRDYYPPYLSGVYYITTPKTAYRITEEAKRNFKHYRYLSVEDVFVTGILSKALNITLRQLPQKNIILVHCEGLAKWLTRHED